MICAACGTPLGPALAHALLHQLAQPGRGVSPCRHQLRGILVAQFVETEGAALRDLQRLPPAARRIQPRQTAALAQMRSPLGYRRAPACASVTPWRMAVSASCRRRRARTCMWTSPLATSGTALPADVLQLREALADPCPCAAAPRRSTDFPGKAAASQCSSSPAAVPPAATGSGSPRDPLPRSARVSCVAALRRRAPAVGNQRGTAAHSRADRWPGRQTSVRRRAELRADDQLQAPVPFAAICARTTPGHRALVGDRERAVTELRPPAPPALRVRCAAQEGEIH